MFDFNRLIHAILGKKEDGVVNDLKSATQLVMELPSSDMLSAQIEITRTLAELNKNSKITAKERIRTVMYLDQKARTVQDKLIRDYFSLLAAEDSGSKQQLSTILAYWNELATGYKTCIRAYTETPTRALEDAVRTITARCLAVYGLLAKWSLLRYMSVDSKIWRNLHRLFVFASSEGFVKDELVLYPGDKDSTSCLKQYFQVLHLTLAPTEKMSPEQIDILSNWLQAQFENVDIEDQIRPHRQAFAINLNDPSGPKKIRRNLMGSHYRYWETDTLIGRAQDCITHLQDGELPVRLHLGEGTKIHDAIDMLTMVSEHWSRDFTPKARRHERSAVRKRVVVSQGLEKLVYHIKHPQKPSTATANNMSGGGQIDYQVHGPASINPSHRDSALFESNLDQWLVENQSLVGIGASFNSYLQDTLRIGTLVGLQPDTGRAFAVGIVRRLRKSRDGQVYVGLENISQTPVVVHLSVHGSNLMEEAIYLPEIQEAKIPRCLVLSPRMFEDGRVLVLRAQGKAFSIKLMQTLDKDDDFVRVAFDVLAKIETEAATNAA